MVKQVLIGTEPSRQSNQEGNSCKGRHLISNISIALHIALVASRLIEMGGQG